MDTAWCSTAKLSYPTRKFASMIAASARKRSGEPIEAYHCMRCHSWHIGHPPGWKYQR